MSMQESFEMTRDNLFSASQIMPVVADKLSIAQAGELERGTLLKADGAIVSSASDEVYAVLAEKVDTTSAAKEAAVYLTGEFNENALKVGGSIAVADVKAAARKVCIFIKPAA
jgi:hypothetical protein